MDAATIARCEEQTLSDVAVAIAPHSESIGSSVVSYSEPGSWLNQCWNFGMKGTVSADELDEIIAFFDSHDCDPRLGLANVAHPSTAKVLAGRGFELEDFINMFVTDLTTADRMSPIPINPAPRGLDIQRVDRSDDESLDRWAELSVRGFQDGDPPPSPKVRTAALVVRHDGVDGYIATMDGEPAAAGALALHETQGHRSASLFATSVLPEFRQLGLQQHLIATRLERALTEGATYAIIGSLPGAATERNVRRFGFELAYVKALLVRRSGSTSPTMPSDNRAH